jgi:hypothetical protein
MLPQTIAFRSGRLPSVRVRRCRQPSAVRRPAIRPVEHRQSGQHPVGFPVARGLWPVACGLWPAARGLRLVACGSWPAVRGLRLAARGPRPEGDKARGPEAPRGYSPMGPWHISIGPMGPRDITVLTLWPLGALRRHWRCRGARQLDSGSGLSWKLFVQRKESTQEAQCR